MMEGGRKRLRKWAFRLLVGLGILAVTIALLPFLPVTRRAVEKNLSARLKRPITIASMGWAPPHIWVKGMTIGDASKAEHVTIDRVVADVDLRALWHRRRLELNTIAVEGWRLDLRPGLQAETEVQEESMPPVTAPPELALADASEPVPTDGTTQTVPNPLAPEGAENLQVATTSPPDGGAQPKMSDEPVVVAEMNTEPEALPLGSALVEPAEPQPTTSAPNTAAAPPISPVEDGYFMEKGSWAVRRLQIAPGSVRVFRRAADEPTAEVAEVTGALGMAHTGFVELKRPRLLGRDFPFHLSLTLAPGAFQQTTVQGLLNDTSGEKPALVGHFISRINLTRPDRPISGEGSIRGLPLASLWKCLPQALGEKFPAPTGHLGAQTTFQGPLSLRHLRASLRIDGQGVAFPVGQWFSDPSIQTQSVALRDAYALVQVAQGVAYVPDLSVASDRVSLRSIGAASAGGYLNFALRLCADQSFAESVSAFQQRWPEESRLEMTPLPYSPWWVQDVVIHGEMADPTLSLWQEDILFRDAVSFIQRWHSIH